MNHLTRSLKVNDWRDLVNINIRKQGEIEVKVAESSFCVPCIQQQTINMGNSSELCQHL